VVARSGARRSAWHLHPSVVLACTRVSPNRSRPSPEAVAPGRHAACEGEARHAYIVTCRLTAGRWRAESSERTDARCCGQRPGCGPGAARCCQVLPGAARCCGPSAARCCGLRPDCGPGRARWGRRRVWRHAWACAQAHPHTGHVLWHRGGGAACTSSAGHRLRWAGQLPAWALEPDKCACAFLTREAARCSDFRNSCDPAWEC